MNTQFSPLELSQYARHFSLAEIGMAGQLRLKNARVLVIGAGGLGSAALFYLAAAGVGTIGILDDDKIEVSNLQRQILYSHDDLHMKKVNIAKQRLAALNPAVQIMTHDLRLRHENALAILGQYDVIVDASDNFATRYIINDACFYLNKPNVQASILRFTGHCTVFTAQKGACYRCLFDEAPDQNELPNCNEAGVLGVLPGIMGSIQATEVIKLIVDIGVPLVNRLLIFNALEMRFRELEVQKNPECRLCQHHQPYDTLSHQPEPRCEEKVAEQITVTELKANFDKYFLLDVREPFEYGICNLGAHLIPLNILPVRLAELDKSHHIVVHCRSGMRSQRAVEILKQHGFTRVSNLTGGILAWGREIDLKMTSY